MFWTSMTTETSIIEIAHRTAQAVRGFYNFHKLYQTLAPKKTNRTTLICIRFWPTLSANKPT